MKEFEFSIILKDVPELTDDVCNRLFEAGCDDSSPNSCDGVTTVVFDREAGSLREAIDSAIKDIRQAGFQISHIETEESSLVEQVNHQLQNA